MFDESTEVKYLIDMKGLKSLQIKTEAYLKPKRVSMIKLFCENS